jgi:photosystem II stability/assembly factor-like uncharacterized protein
VSGGAIVVTGTSAWWGPGLRVSTDLGATWQEPSSVRFAEGRGHSVERVWITKQARTPAGETVLYAGVAPAALFRSSDGGATWEEVQSLTDHESRPQWTPGGGGLMVHSLCPHPTDPARLFVGISAAGAFRTDDGGETWAPKNRGVRADFTPDKFPEVGVCVHHMEMHPANPDILYQQNHCGVYRTDNAGDDWTDISDGLPSRFGFPFAVLPHNGDTVFVCPVESDEYRLMPDGAFRIYRSRNRGDAWEPLTDGLPQTNAHQIVLRHGMTTDTLDPAGVYVGTAGGQLLASRDEGDHWELLFNWLPPITSVQTAVVDR